MMLAAFALACCLGALSILATLYRAIAAVAWLRWGRSRVLAPADSDRRFAVVIPAHDEELLIEHVIRSVRLADYPQERIEIHVIADNCSDRTADRVEALGEHAWRRSDPLNRGKGQALGWLFERLPLSEFQAIALFDSDVL